MLVVASHHLAEGGVGFALLHLEHLGHAGVGTRQGEFPAHEGAVKVVPVVDVACLANPVADGEELLAVVALHLLGHQGIAVQVLLDRQQDLHRVHGLDKVVSDFAADGLVHDVLLLAFGDHDHGHVGLEDFDLLQSFESADAGHVLVEDDEIEVLLLQCVECVAAVGHCAHFIALAVQKQDVGLEQVDFVVGPKDEFLIHCWS